MIIRERRKRIYRKRIPYGMQNFEDVIKEDCYYVDKTPFIEDIEEANKYFFYIRPRRFGKTLTMSMLMNYYDVNKKEQFDDIFGKLYIGQYPTPERNTYLVIRLNFAVIVGRLDDYKDGMDAYCNTQFNYFADVYSHLLPEGTKEGLREKKDAIEQFLSHRRATGAALQGGFGANRPLCRQRHRAQGGEDDQAAPACRHLPWSGNGGLRRDKDIAREAHKKIQDFSKMRCLQRCYTRHIKTEKKEQQ